LESLGFPGKWSFGEKMLFDSKFPVLTQNAGMTGIMALPQYRANPPQGQK
jgi:hypothetical protein